MNTYPVYLKSLQEKKLNAIGDEAFSLLEACSLCPRKCGINRLSGKKGFCKTGLLPKVYSYQPHHGEEPPISGRCGSGTIFFSNCNLHCSYCQNYKFSQLDEGREIEFEELAEFMLRLQKQGCHNINLVSPTHVMPQILKSLNLAASKGLNIPIVYNTNGYELSEIVKLLEGIIDIYLPDMRYSNPDTAKEFSMAADYPRFNQTAVKEMHRQVGCARIDKSGIITRGVIIRHLVLPNDLSGTDQIMRFIATELSPDSYISLMNQYFPFYKASGIKEISRRIFKEEYVNAINIMHSYGLHNGWTQDAGDLERFAGINIKSNI